MRKLRIILFILIWMQCATSKELVRSKRSTADEDACISDETKKYVDGSCDDCEEWDTHAHCPPFREINTCVEEDITHQQALKGKITLLSQSTPCEFTIKGPSGAVIVVESDLALNHKALPDNCVDTCTLECRDNYIEVYDLTSTEPRTRHCGVQVGITFTSQTNQVVLAYNTNAIEGTFQAKYQIYIQDLQDDDSDERTLVICDGDLRNLEPSNMLHYCIEGVPYDISAGTTTDENGDTVDATFNVDCRCPDTAKYQVGDTECYTLPQCEAFAITTTTPATTTNSPATTTPLCGNGHLVFISEPVSIIRWCYENKAEEFVMSEAQVLGCQCPDEKYEMGGETCLTKEECEGTTTTLQPTTPPTTTTPTTTTTTTTTPTTTTTTTTTTTPTTTPAPTTTTTPTTTTSASTSVRCGVPRFQPVLKIYGGVGANPGSFPWMAQIVKEDPHANKKMVHCGGTLICNRHVVTAAHCFLNSYQNGILSDISMFDLYLGSHASVGNAEANNIQPQIFRNLKRTNLFIHKSYKIPSLNNLNDIAVIKLESEAIITDTVRPACLPVDPRYIGQGEVAEPRPNTVCRSAGWGQIRKSKPQSAHLKEVKIKVQFDGKCINLYTGYDIDTMLCAQGTVKADDTCQGDSGGPLMCYRNEQWFLDGVVSHGLECASNNPSVYSRVGTHRDWILNKIAKVSNTDCVNWDYEFNVST